MAAAERQVAAGQGVLSTLGVDNTLALSSYYFHGRWAVLEGGALSCWEPQVGAGLGAQRCRLDESSSRKVGGAVQRRPPIRRRRVPTLAACEMVRRQQLRPCCALPLSPPSFP